MIRVVLDTNVLAPGAIASQGVVAGIMDAWRADAFTLVFSAPIGVELVRTLLKPYFAGRLTTAAIMAYLALLVTRSEIVTVTSQITGVASHPEDDLILATALDGRADYLVTGDAQLQKLKTFRGVAIVSPREFLTMLTDRSLQLPAG
jgi:putative PIN family toxin of toxin-antitoxin system